MDEQIIGSVCYKLYPLWDNPAELKYTIYSNEVFLAGYVGSYVKVRVPIIGNPEGCYYVEISTTCPSPQNNLIEIVESCTADPYCYAIGGSGVVNYVDINDSVISTFAPTLVCSRVIPDVISDSTYGIVNKGNCNEDGCSPFCFVLTNCSTQETLQSSSQALITPYTLNQTITIEGYEGCWTVTTDVECTCLVDIVIKKVFDSCETCLPIIAYKLTNCKNNKQIKYTQQDLSAYVNKTVNTDCGNCWSVSEINYQPPSLSTVNITATYDTCTACSRIYWILNDCKEIAESIITYSDLASKYHKSIKLLNSDICWFVDSLPPGQDVSGAITVSIASEYDNCNECAITATCLCTRVTNKSDTELSYAYVNCDNVLIEFTLAPGNTSDKFCLNRWVTNHIATDVIETFGDCIENSQGVKTCPIKPSGRMIAPGYFVPACSTEKYEEIVCKSSEIFYKQVLQLRYGISNCCPDEDDKWILERELLDMKALLDPDYVCEISTDTCCQTSTCECSSCKS